MKLDNACPMSTKDKVKLLITRDDDLLMEFPKCRRSDLRFLKRELTKPKAPRILIFDTENSQMVVKVWQLKGNDYIDPKRIIKDWFVICWSAKWLFADEILHDCITPQEARQRDDKRIMKSIKKLFDEADIVIAHNGDKFDIAKLKTRFIKHKISLPSPYRTIDTLKVARKEFKLSSNTLDYLCKYLGLDVKIETGGIDLWDKCESGDETALKKMTEYCDNDSRILEEVYLRIRQYINNHPDVGLYMETTKKVCPNCGSKNLKWEGFYTTLSNKYKTARCSCGAIVRSKENYV